MTNKTAHWWTLSNDPEAVTWRAQAHFSAYQNVVVAALNDHKAANGTIQIPPSEIEKPPVFAGTYITIPDAPAAAPNFFSQPQPLAPAKPAPAAAPAQSAGTGGKFFTIPGVTEAATPITKGQNGHDWLADDDNGGAYFTTTTEGERTV